MKRVYQIIKWNKIKIFLISNKCMHLHKRKTREKLIMKEEK